MVLKNPFDELVEDIRRKQFVDIGMGEWMGEGLNIGHQTANKSNKEVTTHHNVSSDAILVPQYSRIKIAEKKVSFLMWSMMGIRFV